MRDIIVASRRYRNIIGHVAVLAAIAGLAQATASAADEPGVWQSHELQFYHLGFTATYTCEGLKTELQGLLDQSGAQQIAVTPAGPCGAATKPSSAWLKFSTLAPAPSGNGGQLVAGSWHHVTMSSQGALLRLGGSCEIVQEFQNKVLPLFATRNVKANLSCVPYQSTGYLFSLSFDVFAPSDAKLRTGGPDVP